MLTGKFPGRGSQFLAAGAQWLAAGLLGAVVSLSTLPALAQGRRAAPPAAEKLQEAERRAAVALAEPAEQPPPAESPAPAASASPTLFEVYWTWGGPLMIPITLMSVIVVICAVERWLGLRRGRVIPSALVEQLSQLGNRPGGLDPRAAYQACQQHPSTLANVLRAALLKVGRPHNEVEQTVKEADEREAARLYRNVRTINLATTVTPLLGLLGTVQGMIECFYTTATLHVGADKSQALAEGIYKALVTTFGGLVVAIPAAILAHYFEGRIQALFREIDELLLGLLPQLERYEGKLRMTRNNPEPSAPVDPRSKPQPTAHGN